MPLLTEFQVKFPEVQLRLLGEMKEANLSRGEADIALRMTKVESAELVIQKICDVTYHFYAMRSLRERKQARAGSSAIHRHIRATCTKLSCNRPAGGQLPCKPAICGRISGRMRGRGPCLASGISGGQISGSADDRGSACPHDTPVYLVMQRDMRNSERVRMLADHIKLKLPKLL